MPAGGETEIPSRKEVCVSTYVACGSLLLIPGQLKPTLAPLLTPRPWDSRRPSPLQLRPPHPRLRNGGRDDQKRLQQDAPAWGYSSQRHLL